MFRIALENLKNHGALVHCITNYVTVNDCANAILAVGGAPIMADDIGEAAEITGICNALVINLGTLNERTISSMLAAGERANALGHPVILDPVGAGASTLRTETVFKLLEKVRFAVIRGNISEIKTVYAGAGTTKGVDADLNDALNTDNQEEVVAFAKKLSERTGAIIAITGETDLIANSEKAVLIQNGHPMMSKITGTGCMLTAILGAFCGANPDQLMEAVVAGVSFMGQCGEIANEKTVAMKGGTSSFRTYLIDAMSQIEPETFEKGMKIDV